MLSVCSEDWETTRDCHHRHWDTQTCTALHALEQAGLYESLAEDKTEVTVKGSVSAAVTRYDVCLSLRRLTQALHECVNESDDPTSSDKSDD